MGQDVTTRVSVLGQNPDGSLNVAMQNNPFAVGSGGATTAMQNQGAAQAYIGRELITFGSEADMLKAKLAIQNLSGGGAGGAPQLAPGGGGGPGGGSSSWLPLAANDYLASSSYSSQSLFSGGGSGTLIAAGLGAGAGLLLSRNNNK